MLPAEERVEREHVIRALVTLGELDLLYADRYLHRAERSLASLCSREQFRVVQADEATLSRIVASLREAAEREDWDTVRTLAHDAAARRARLAGTEAVAHLAAAVYGARPLPTATTLALDGVLALPKGAPKAISETLLGHLRFLIGRDPEWGPFYRRRLNRLERLARDDEAGADDSSVRRQRILEAVKRGAFGEVERLAANGHVSFPTRPGESEPGRPAGASLVTAFDPRTLARARDLGLAPELLIADPLLERYVQGYADAPAHGARATLVENLRLIFMHPFVSSPGRRYLPRFRTEQILVETFPEADPATRTPLLDVLGLPARRGLPRAVIEDVIRRHTTDVCEALELDPFEFTLACIPFDAYLRLAPRHRWGEQALWTHFDGYQLTPELTLRALVGGDVRYGGPDDFCSVGRGYDSDRLTARFAVLRRERFVLYDGHGGALD
jgi:hypothetical protein